MESTTNRHWRIVLDTASFISAVRSRRGAASELIRLFLLNQLTLVMDMKLSLEYRDVALRPEHLLASQRSTEEMTAFIQVIEDKAEPVHAVLLLRPLSPDPNDDMILELAVAAGVDVIVTTNIRHLRRDAGTFGILVMTPGEFLAQLERKP